MQDSNSRLSLSLAAPPHAHAHAFHPRDVLRPRVTILGSPIYSSLSLRLRGRTTATIMGKDRWQAGQLANVGMGGSGILVTSTETLTFLDLTVPLVGSSRARVLADKGDKHGGHEETPEGGVYEVTLPPPPHGQLLPSYSDSGPGDAAGVRVWYTLQVLGTRHGMFKPNDKLSIELPVAIPLPASRELSPSEWPSNHPVANTQVATDDASPLHLSYKPLTGPGATLEFSVDFLPNHLTPSWSTPPTLTASLSRRIRTAPIDSPDSGRDFAWAGIRVAPGTIVSSDISKGHWEGVVQIPKGQVTVQSKGVDVTYVLTVKVLFNETKTHVLASVPVFLPSADAVAAGASESASEGGDLPPYEP